MGTTPTTWNSDDKRLGFDEYVHVLEVSLSRDFVACFAFSLFSFHSLALMVAALILGLWPLIVLVWSYCLILILMWFVGSMKARPVIVVRAKKLIQTGFVVFHLVAHALWLSFFVVTTLLEY